MEKELSAGIIIHNVTTGHFLAVHPTGRRWGKHSLDIPKGHVEPGEEPIEAAVRELAEETGIKLKPADISCLVNFGLFDYRPTKDLWLFGLETGMTAEEEKIYLKKLHCDSYFQDAVTGDTKPENDGFVFTDKLDSYFSSLQPCIESCLKTWH